MCLSALMVLWGTSLELRNMPSTNHCLLQGPWHWWMKAVLSQNPKKWVTRWVSAGAYLWGILINFSLHICTQKCQTRIGFLHQPWNGVLPDLVKFMDSVHARMMTVHKLGGAVEIEAGETSAGKEFPTSTSICHVLNAKMCSKHNHPQSSPNILMVSLESIWCHKSYGHVPT